MKDPTYGKQYDSAYPIKLQRIGIELLEEYKGAKSHHMIKCVNCNHIWSATPISKIQAFNKYGFNGCPRCKQKRQQHQKEKTFEKIKQDLLRRGIEILSSGVIQLTTTTTKVKFKNHNCGHIFESAPGNIVFKHIDCPICGKEERSTKLTQTVKDRSAKWRKTATEWQLYKSKVASLSRKNYLKHQAVINPNNLPRGKAGCKGAYHLDHIVPVRYCFEHQIPEEVCAHHENLQMLGWEENVGSRDKLKENVDVPVPLRLYISCQKY